MLTWIGRRLSRVWDAAGLADAAFVLACLAIAFSAVQRIPPANSPPGNVVDESGVPGAYLGLAKGHKLSIDSIDFRAADRTVLLLFDSRCVYCRRSLPLYKRIAAEGGRHKDYRFVVLGRESQGELEASLIAGDVKPDQVVTVSASEFPARLTPTLALVDADGVVEQVWVGFQAPEVENALLRRLGSEE